jgi:ABC-2 type transport system ATP-binding protein
VELTPSKGKALREYSKGMLQRIGIAQAILHTPELVILDEPMSGLDPDGRFKINQILKNLGDSGTTVFFSSHLLDDAEKLCKNLVILSKGALVYTGSTEGLLQNMHVGYIVSYKDGSGVKTVTVANENALQNKIDELRTQQVPIIEVRNDRPNLEKAFVRLSGGPT